MSYLLSIIPTNRTTSIISADMWSLACIVFELLTGDLLFDPRAGEGYERDEDHLAQCVELLGKIPKKVAQTGRYSK